MIFTPRFRKASSCSRLWSDAVVELGNREDLRVGFEGGFRAHLLGRSPIRWTSPVGTPRSYSCW